MFDLVKIPRAGRCPVCNRDVKWLATFDIDGVVRVEQLGADSALHQQTVRAEICPDCLRRKANEVFIKASSTNVSEAYDGESTRYAEPLIGDSQR